MGQGIPGVLILAAWCALGFTAVWKMRGMHPQLAACLAAALAAGIVSQQFTVFTIPTAVIFFGTIALAAGTAFGNNDPIRRFPFALPLLYFAVRIAFAETSDLWYSRSLLTAAQKATNIGDRLEAFHRATLAGERATRTAEDPFDAWYSLSSIRAAQNNAAATEQCLRAAMAAHPTWFKPHWTLAQVLSLDGRNEEVRREAALAVDPDGGKHPEVAQTLQELSAR